MICTDFYFLLIVFFAASGEGAGAVTLSRNVANDCVVECNGSDGLKVNVKVCVDEVMLLFLDGYGLFLICAWHGVVRYIILAILTVLE